jgi:hypothetical protein
VELSIEIFSGLHWSENGMLSRSFVRQSGCEYSRILPGVPMCFPPACKCASVLLLI